MPVKVDIQKNDLTIGSVLGYFWKSSLAVENAPSGRLCLLFPSATSRAPPSATDCPKEQLGQVPHRSHHASHMHCVEFSMHLRLRTM